MKDVIKKILKENFNPEDFSWVPKFEYEPIRDSKHRYDIIMGTIVEVKKYGDWKISVDEMSGTVEWYGNGNWVGLVTPEWSEEFEIPIDVTNGSDYTNVDVIKTPKFEYTIQVTDWYRNQYFKKVNEILLKWKEKN